MDANPALILHNAIHIVDRLYQYTHLIHALRLQKLIEDSLIRSTRIPTFRVQYLMQCKAL